MLTYETNRVVYNGVGGLTFLAVPFPFFDNEDLSIYEVHNGAEKKLVLGDDYLVQNIEGQSRQINFINGYQPPLASNMTIVRTVPLTQIFDWDNNDKFDAKTFTKAFDRIVMMCQQLDDRFSRAVLLPDGANVDPIQLPTPEEGRMLVWGTGSQLVNADIPSGGSAAASGRDPDPNDPDPNDGHVPFYLGDGSVFVIGSGEPFEVKE